ncbi:MAG: hypothetical protein C5B59_05615 [Bacteroidetes bacterium]|nr:MAG: hypothetical protein C5B59_05615 [Bacteroidota bacterium]
MNNLQQSFLTHTKPNALQIVLFTSNLALTKFKFMRKGIADSQAANIPFNQRSLTALEKHGYKYVQIKGLSTDNHYDYIETRFLVLIPLKELPLDPNQKDIYEPIDSKLLRRWAQEENESPKIVIAEHN